MGALLTMPVAVAQPDKFPIVPVCNGIVPDEALAITCNLQFSPTVQAILIDLSESTRKFNVVPIQGAFIDTSGSAIDLRVDNSVTGQSVLAKAGLQGYYNLLCPMPAKLIAVLASAPASQLNITMILYNTSIETEVWGLTTGPAGATGPQGPPGPTGATGATGPQGPSGAIASVQNQGTAVTPVRSILNFTGAGVTATDNAGAGRTDITIPGPPIATASVLGAVKIGTNVNVAGDGTISVPPVAAFQTPWLSSINGATNSLTNVNTVSANNYSYAGTTGNPSVEQWLMNGSVRWRWSTVGPESGSNAGTNLQLQGYADDGSTIIDNPAISVVRSSGFVGIGPGNAQYQLDVRTPGSTASQVHIASTNTDAGAYLMSGADSQAILFAGSSYNGSAYVAKANAASALYQNAGAFTWYTDTGLTVGSTYIPTARVTLTSAGNVGIGTTTPNQKLSVLLPTGVGGTILGLGANGAQDVIQFGYTNATSTAYLEGSPYGPTEVKSLSTYPLLLNASNTNNVGIGTTGPAATLDVNGTMRCIGYAAPTSGAGIEIEYISGVGYILVYDRTGAAAKPLVLQNVAGGQVGIGMTPTHQLQLSADDAAKPTTNTWTIASGAAVKRNVKRLTGGLEIINKLNPTVAEYNGKNGTPKGQRVVSLIAEEVRTVLPHTVTEDADGNLGFNVHEVIHHLILAVQQLSRKLDAVKA